VRPCFRITQIADEGGVVHAHDVTFDWADLSAVPEATGSWAHNGIVVTRAGEVIGFHAGHLVTFDRDGHLSRSVKTGLTEGHGITLVREGGDEALWVSDPGFVFEVGVDDGDEEWAPVFGRGVRVESRQPRVVKMSLDGEILSELPTPRREPESPPGMMGEYCPCGTAVDEERFGGNGDIWVADGYGSSLVHCFDKHGNLRLTLTGEEGGGRFLCPHAVFIDRRGGKTPELYIADRENKRIQAYDLRGRHLRTFGDGFLNSPSGFAVSDDLLIVAELYSRLAVIDVEDNFVGYVGADEGARKGLGWPERPGWPNELSGDARAVRAQLSVPNVFNSPHSLAVDADGYLYVTEWLIGGRYTKLKIGA
jgi:DNA-binding beta-propeller fold protein YncE